MLKRICIDFDGVIRINNEPAKGVFKALNHFQGNGYETIVFTARNTKEVKKWLKIYGFPKIKVTNIKPDGVCAFIDDRAVRFTNWEDIAKRF